MRRAERRVEKRVEKRARRPAERRGVTGGEAGLTLIELVVAMAVFALIAVMGLQGLSGALRLQDGLESRAGRSARLIDATALLRNDLAAIVPMLFFPPGGGGPQSALRRMGGGQSGGQGGGLALSVSAAALGGPEDGSEDGPRDGSEGDPGLQRVEWRHDAASGRLSRRVWPVLYPVAADQAGPEVTVLDGVAALELRSYWTGFGWIAGLRPAALESAPRAASDGDRAGPAPETYSDLLPRALEVTLETRDFGRLTLVEYLQ